MCVSVLGLCKRLDVAADSHCDSRKFLTMDDVVVMLDRNCRPTDDSIDYVISPVNNAIKRFGLRTDC
jgi:hypothetical protein